MSHLRCMWKKILWLFQEHIDEFLEGLKLIFIKYKKSPEVAFWMCFSSGLLGYFFVFSIKYFL